MIKSLHLECIDGLWNAYHLGWNRLVFCPFQSIFKVVLNDLTKVLTHLSTCHLVFITLQFPFLLIALKSMWFTNILNYIFFNSSNCFKWLFPNAIQHAFNHMFNWISGWLMLKSEQVKKKMAHLIRISQQFPHKPA